MKRSHERRVPNKNALRKQTLRAVLNQHRIAPIRHGARGRIAQFNLDINALQKK
jgi:hypothetical protein